MNNTVGKPSNYSEKDMPEAPSYFTWYINEIELDIRDVVFALRNRGVNTTQSCGHEMWIWFDSIEPTSELQRIWEALTDLGITDYQVNLHYNNPGNDHFVGHGRIYLGDCNIIFYTEEGGGE